MGNVIRTPGAPKEDQGAAQPRLPIGTYDFRVEKYEQATSSGGNNQLVIDLAVSEGTYVGRTIKVWLTMTEGAQWRIQQFLEASGIEYWEEKGFTVFDADDLEGAELRAEVTHREYNGKTYPDVNNFQALFEDSGDADEEADEPADAVEESAPAAPTRRRRRPSA